MGLAQKRISIHMRLRTAANITVAAQGAEGLQIDVEQAGETGGTATVTVTSPFGEQADVYSYGWKNRKNRAR